MKSLRNSELASDYELHLAALPVAALRLSGSDLIITDINDIGLSLLNKQSDVIGQSLPSIIPQVASSEFFSYLEQARTLTDRQAVFHKVAPLPGKGNANRSIKLSFRYCNEDKIILTLTEMNAINDATAFTPGDKALSDKRGMNNLADSMPQLVWIADADGTVTYYNNQVRNFSGARQAEDGQWQWEGMLHPEDLEATVVAWTTAVARQTMYQMEHRVKMKDGSYRWHLSRAFSHQNGDGLKWYGTAADIQQIKDAESSVRESEERFRIMADATPTIVWELTPEGSHRYLNKFALDYLGVNLRQAVELDWKPFIHPDDFHSTQETLTQAIRQHKPYSKEHRLLRHDGEYRWFLSQGGPSYYPDGTLYGFVGSGTDIHEWKLAQAQLKRNEEMLENLVKERTLELQRSNSDLQQFAHVASHDLKEPLRKIKTFSYKLRDEFTTHLNERADNLISKIIHSSDRMNAMINGVLNYASLDSHHATFLAIDLNKLVSEIRADLELMIQEKEAVIHCTPLPTVNGNPEQIRQLFSNLLNNALKFAKPANGDGSTLIELSAQPFTGHRGFAEIVIRDNGIGFDNEYAEQIFGTFTRLHSKDKYEGSGLGLAMCRRIVERHGGIISADGKEGEGAVFVFTLPLSNG